MKLRSKKAAKRKAKCLRSKKTLHAYYSPKLEALETRRLLAGDFDPWQPIFNRSKDSIVSTISSGLIFDTSSMRAEGEAANDLVAFAKALDDAGVTFFGAAWCPFCTQQKELFQDGYQYLPFVEVTNPDRSLNSTGQAEGIETFPTWDFPDGTRVTGVLSLQEISDYADIPIPQGETPSFAPIGDLTVEVGSPLHIPIDAYDPNDTSLTVTVSVANPALLQGSVLQNNRSARISVENWGDMVFELFEDKAERPADRFIELAQSGFYNKTADGQIIFHRVIDNFVLQAGDPTGTGSGGSTLGDFDDQYHPDLQHNRTGILSYAKSLDDTNNSQFFITEGQQRHLDYQHSIFGQLVEGDAVREAISETATSISRPTNNIVISNVEIFEDTENSVVMLKATGAGLGQTDVTITVTDGDGNSYSEVIAVTVIADQDNASPYLQDIAPVSTPAGVPAVFNLQGVDVEGDPIVYEARVVDSSGATVIVNQSTGQVTVTPPVNFSGQILVEVAARSVDTPTSTSASTRSVTMDLQTVAVNVGPSVPTGLSLLASSDTGLSNSDGITNAALVTFQVTGIQPGATVEILAGDIPIGVATATATIATITTNNFAALGNATHTVTARQTVNGLTSAKSTSINVTYDTVPPANVPGIPAQASVGVNYLANLQGVEEGSGLRYAIVSAPTGLTIDSQTGQISWTPRSDQTGDQSIVVRMTDIAGNSIEQTFSVNVGADPIVEIRLEIVDAAGNIVNSLAPSEEFRVRVYASDLRDGLDAAGVFALYTDVLFDPQLAEGIPNSFAYDTFYNNGISGSVGQGIIDEVGSFASSTSPLGAQERLIFSFGMRALAIGTLTITSDPAEDGGRDIALFNLDDAVSPNQVIYGSASVEIREAAVLVTTLTESADPATPGESLTYTVTVSNTGGSDAENVIAFNVLPSGAVFVSATAPAGIGALVDNVLSLPFGTIRAGETQIATVVVQIPGNARGVLASTVSVAGDGLSGGIVSDTELTTLAPNFDVTVTQSVSQTTVSPGSNVQFSINVSNSVPSVSTAVGVIATNILPAGLTLNSASLNGINLTNLSNIAIPELEPGESATILVDATVDSGIAIGQILANTVLLSAPSETNVLTNTSATSVTVTEPEITGTLAWYKIDEMYHTIPGVVFEVTQTHRFDFNLQQMVDIPDRVLTVVDNLAPDTNPSFGEFRLGDLSLGRYSIREKTPLPGYDIDATVRSYDLTPATPFNYENCGPLSHNFPEPCPPVWVSTISTRFLVGSNVAARKEYLAQIAQADINSQDNLSGEGEVARAGFAIQNVNGNVTLLQTASGLGITLASTASPAFVTTTDLPEDLSIDSLAALQVELIVDAGDGDDMLRLARLTNWRINGGQGIDKLLLDTQGVLDLTSRSVQLVNVEEIELNGGPGQQVILDADTVAGMNSARNALVKIQSAQQLNLIGNWQAGPRTVHAGQLSQEFRSGPTTIRVTSENPWQNLVNRFDANEDGASTALDALQIINAINRGVTGQFGSAAISDAMNIRPFDVNGDGQLSPLDALGIINHLNGRRLGEGEAAAVPYDLTTSQSDQAIEKDWDALMNSAQRSFEGSQFIFVDQAGRLLSRVDSRLVEDSIQMAIEEGETYQDLEQILEILALEHSTEPN